MLFALVVAACGHRAPAPVVHHQLGESTAPGPRMPLSIPPDAAIVTSGAITTREVTNAPAPAAPTTPTPPASDAQPGVASPPPVNP
jgi:hypothetical protein